MGTHPHKERVAEYRRTQNEVAAYYDRLSTDLVARLVGEQQTTPDEIRQQAAAASPTSPGSPTSSSPCTTSTWSPHLRRLCRPPTVERSLLRRTRVPRMTAGDDLLRRIETTPALAELLIWPGDFDIERRDPVEELRLPSGAPLTPIAGDASGATYFLCGTPGTTRPVLYADSEGSATLVAADLVEAVTLIAAYPYWHDLLHDRLHGHAIGEVVEELEEDMCEDHPDYPAARAELLRLLGVTPPTPEDAVARLRASAARTVPGFLPIAMLDEGEISYTLL
ncbi:hypothetical protein E1295_25560 [Nonomuraea mesophila]|uniref:Uncharacterized protein n=1 Tax=Nonomuraea mesophila TaxID=2530382 RepID=A0A4R5F8Q5_9ACTN|nr:hypothetical protein [Nonomuraea mesophila]TDE44110.1 hypothetical protein E1295_25560 [Nonomuraea mesophila]